MSNVNHPAHYNHGIYEPIDVIRDWDLNFNLGNSVKYIARAKHKNNELEDLEKARFYLDYEIKKLKLAQEGNFIERCVKELGLNIKEDADGN